MLALSPQSESKAASTPVVQFSMLPKPQSGHDFTLALIKPDAAEFAEQISQIIRVNLFEIIFEKQFVFSVAQAEEFYAEHREKPFFSSLVAFMSR